MNVLTVKIPEVLDAALRAASRASGLSKSEMVRQALEQCLNRQAEQAGAAGRWVTQWRGRMASKPVVRGPKGAKTSVADDRLAHLLAKHLH